MRTVETFTVADTMAGVRAAIAEFERFGRSHGVPRAAAWRVQLAIDEILSNIVRHASPRGPAPIAMTFSLEDGVVAVEIVDSAEAFNPLLEPAPDTTSPLDERQPGGLGISLVRRLMDETLYERRDDRNHFVMRCLPHADC